MIFDLKDAKENRNFDISYVYHYIVNVFKYDK